MKPTDRPGAAAKTLPGGTLLRSAFATRMWRAVGFTLLLALAAAGCGRGGGEPEQKLDVLLITLDTVRADRLGCYGYDGARTPNLDALAASGVLFENAFCQVPLTLPSHTSILTGLYPPNHGVRLNDTQRVGDDVETLAGILKGNGYRTAAFVSAFVLNSQFGLDRNFDIYEDLPAPGGDVVFAERRGAETAALAANWLATVPDGPFFLWVHFFDAHRPYDPPAPHDTEFAGRPYDGEIAEADAAVGTVLRALEEYGRSDRTIVVAVADHGESLGEHGEETHALFVYDSTIRVPLIVRIPEAAAAKDTQAMGTRVSRVVETVDIVPTVLDLLDEPAPRDLDGRDLFREEESRGRLAYAESLYGLSFGWCPLRSVRTDEFKYTEAPRPELYRWVSDRGETTNLADGEREAADEMRRSMPEWVPVREGKPGLDGENREALRSLGYLSASVSTPAAWDLLELPDPKDHAEDFETINLAREEIREGRFEAAVRMLTEVAERDPEDPVLFGLLGTAYTRMVNWTEGVRCLEKATKLAPEDPEGHYLLGVALIRSGSPAEACGPLERSVELLPSYAAAWDQLGVARGMSQDFAGALAAGTEAAVWDPKNAEYRKNLGVTLLRLGKRSQAAGEFREGLRLRPGDEDLTRHLKLALRSTE